jgi:hypothetical protein
MRGWSTAEQRISRMLADPDARDAIMAIPVNDRDAAAARTAERGDLDINDSHNPGERPAR